MRKRCVGVMRKGIAAVIVLAMIVGVVPVPALAEIAEEVAADDEVVVTDTYEESVADEGQQAESTPDAPSPERRLADQTMEAAFDDAMPAELVKSVYVTMVNALADVEKQDELSVEMRKSLTTQESVATRFRLTMDLLSIDCIEISTDDGSYIWDMVNIDDAWYHVDVWAAVQERLTQSDEDQEVQRGEEPPLTFLLISDSTIAELDESRVQWKQDDGSEVPISGDDYQWIVANNDDADSSEEAVPDEPLEEEETKAEAQETESDSDEDGEKPASDGNETEPLEGESSNQTLATQGNTAELNYEIGQNGEITVTGPIDKNITMLTVPSQIDGHAVAEIASSAFYDCDALTSVALPDTLESVGTDAFQSCDKLASVTLPSNQWGCTLSDDAFRECPRLTSVSVPATIKTSGSPFYKSGLQSATVEQGATKVQDSLFSYCESLTSVSLPASVTEIGSSAFSGCKSLAAIPELPSGISKIGSSAFYNCDALTSVALPDTLESVGADAFRSCDRLASVTLPSNQWGCTLGYGAFGECPRLTSVSVPATIKTSGSPFYKSGLQSATVEQGATKVQDSLFSYCESLTSVSLPASVTEIGSSAFYNCDALTAVALPDSVESVGADAFRSCDRLASVTLPSNQWGCTLGYGAFGECPRLTSVSVPATIKASGSPFYKSGLQSATVEQGATKVQDSLFSYCESLTSVSLPASVTEIGSSAFSGCKSLAAIPELPSGISKIGSSAFYNCDALTSVALPDTLESVGADAFRSCDRLASVTLPSNQWGCTLGYGAFGECPRLTSVSVPATIKTSGSPFYKSGLQSATVEQGATKVQDSLFSYCESLTSVSLPASVTEIGSSAFSGCKSLAEIQLPESLTAINSSAFYNTTSLSNLSMPATISSIGYSAFDRSAVTLYCVANSYSVVYAIENDIPFSISSSAADSGSLAINRSSTKYTANLDAVSTNGYVDATVKYSIKESWKKSAKPSKVIIYLPKNAELEEGSVLLNGSATSDYTLSWDGRTLSIPVSMQNSVVKYQIRMTSQEDFTSYAYLQVTKSGTDTREVIGVINEPMSVLTMDIPATITSNTFEATGIAPAQSPISIFIGSTEVANTTSSKAGSWKATIPLSKPQNYRTYEVKAVCYTESGELEQTAKTCYEQDAATMNKFTISYSENGKQTTRDLLNSTTKPLVYYAPSQEFTFEVGYTHPEQIDTLYVTSTRNNEKKYIQAAYDSSKDAFVASGFFDPNDHSYVPGTLSVEYTKPRQETQATEDFDWAEYSPYLPSKTVSATKNSNGQYETVIDFSKEYPEYVKDATKIGVAVSDWKNETELSSPFKDMIDVAETNGTILSYIVPGMDDDRYIFNFDYTDKDRYLMLVKDVSENKYVEIVLNNVIDSTSNDELWTKLSKVSGYLSTAGTIADVMLKQKGIDSDIADLRKEVYGLGLSPSEQSVALKRVDQLHKDRTNFMVLSAAIPLFMTAAGLTGPAGLVLTGMLGIIGTTSSLFWDMRAAQIKGEKFRINWVIDPSGSVYDGATNEPLEGVTATAYWIESDGSSGFFDNPPADSNYGTLWDASEYDQANPLLTNGDGKYAWNVPEGWWRVKYEKDGYATQWSSWMTVPPIQTGIDAYMKRPFSKAEVSEVPDQAYSGSALMPKPKVSIGDKLLNEGDDYILSYKNNTNVGTATISVTGKGGYAGTQTVTFRILPTDIRGANVLVSPSSCTYDGKAKTPKVTVKLGDKTLKAGTDYTLSYGNNVNVGIATVAISGKGGYEGSLSRNFSIDKATNTLSASAKSKKVNLKASKLKKKAQNISRAKAFVVRGAQGKVTYQLKSVAKTKFKKYFKVTKSGKITVKKGLKKGTYTLTVLVSAAGDANHTAITKTVKVKVAVK